MAAIKPVGTANIGRWSCHYLLVAEDDPEKRISELERQLAEAKENAGQASSVPPPQPPSGWPQASQPQAGAPGQPQAYPPSGPAPQPFPPPPAVGPTGGNLGSWPGQSPSTGWRGQPAFGGRPRRRGRYGWLLVVPVLLLLSVFKHPVLQFVQRTVDHHSAAHHSTASQPAEPLGCDVLTSDIVIPVLGSDAAVTDDSHGLCGYKSARGFAGMSIGEWTLMKPSGSDVRPVSGLGDEAAFSADDLYVRKGTVGVKITLSEGLFTGPVGIDDAKLDNAEEAIAQQVLPKL
jgi:hypothetical protein